MQTNPIQQVARQREYELQKVVHENLTTPGVREMAELAKVKAAQAHMNYIKAGPGSLQDAALSWAREVVWLEVARTIEDGAKLDQLKKDLTNG
jgi:hypothetical protein